MSRLESFPAAKPLALLALLLALLASAPLRAQQDTCTQGALAPEIGGDGFGTMSIVSEQEGTVRAAITEHPRGLGRVRNVARIQFSDFCALNGGVRILPYHVNEHGNFDETVGWGSASLSGSFTSPRGGQLSFGFSAVAPELLTGQHDGQAGPQVELIVDGVAASPGQSVSMPVGPGGHSFVMRVRNVETDPLTGADTLEAHASMRLVMDAAPALAVYDVERFGQGGAGLGGVNVSLLVDGSRVAQAQTAADGSFSFPGRDPDELFDLQLDRDGLVRVYQAVRLGSLAAGQLTLPLTLRTRLSAELTKLEQTPTLVLAYDTARARDLMQDWNSALAELPDVHAARDRALARLLVAAEGMAGLFSETAPLATDTAKLTVDTVTTLLSVRKLMSEVGELAARQAAEAGSSARRRLAIEFIVTALELVSEKLQAAAVDGVKSVLPAWASDLFEQSLKAIVATLLEAFSSGQWSSGDARAGLLEAVTTELAAQVGGRVLASGYVLQTNEDLDIAQLKARRLDGSGTVLEGFAAAQQRVADVGVAHQELLALNATLGDTAKGWSTVADLSLLAARRPGGQLIAAIGSVVKGVSAGALVGLSVANYHALYDTAFEQAPGVVRDAFETSSDRAAATAGSLATMQSAVGSGFSSALAALRSALQSGSEEDVLAAGEQWLLASEQFDAALGAERLRLLALGGDDVAAGVRDALDDLLASESFLLGERVVLHGHLAGRYEPDFADPAVGSAELLAQVDAVQAALTALEGALAAAQGATQGLVAGPVLVLAGHGLDAPMAALDRGPGPFVLRAELVNAGDEAAADVSVRLELEVEGAAGGVEVLDPLLQSIGALPPGAQHTLQWRGGFAAPFGAGPARIVTYRIVPQLASGRAESATGGFLLQPSKDRVFGGGFESP
jgi:hypothetical protein